ncbi:MAG: HAD family hydrolase [Firmicutes bacterium]|nr:HAD family hydrolase [Bacillota bacterium]
MMPEMIIFDYGKTLFKEGEFVRKKGIKAVIEKAVRNPMNIDSDTIEEFAKELDAEIGRFDPQNKENFNLEVHNHSFMNYLYEYFGLEFDLSVPELEEIFWNNVCEVSPTENVNELMEYLYKKGIRTGVISNISISGAALKKRIDNGIKHHFEFIIASSEYVFRKPSKRLFELALRKAGSSADKVWYCGDNPYFDMKGANDSGLYPIWYTYNKKDENLSFENLPFEHLHICNWNELIEYIEKMTDKK